MDTSARVNRTKKVFALTLGRKSPKKKEFPFCGRQYRIGFSVCPIKPDLKLNPGDVELFFVRGSRRNPMKPLWLLLTSAVCASLGQVLFKKGVFGMGEITLRGPFIGELIKLIFNPSVFLGLVLYILSTILWLIALSKTTLNFVYPFTALTFVFVMLAARVVFLEPIPLLRYFGVALICLGFLLSSLA